MSPRKKSRKPAPSERQEGVPGIPESPSPAGSVRPRVLKVSSTFMLNDSGVVEGTDGLIEHWLVSEGGKPRHLLVAPFDPNRTPPGLEAHLTRYDVVLAIDTNSRTIGSDHVSVTAVVQRLANGDASSGVVVMMVEVHNCRVDPEEHGWLMLLDMIERVPEATALSAIAIITDHGRSALPALNARSARILDARALPQNVTMIHASDRASDSTSNRMVLHAHAAANAILDRIESGNVGAVKLYSSPHSAPTSHFRVWTDALAAEFEGGADA